MKKLFLFGLALKILIATSSDATASPVYCDLTISGSISFPEFQERWDLMKDRNRDRKRVICLKAGTRVYARVGYDDCRLQARWNNTTIYAAPNSGVVFEAADRSLYGCMPPLPNPQPRDPDWQPNALPAFDETLISVGRTHGLELHNLTLINHQGTGAGITLGESVTANPPLNFGGNVKLINNVRFDTYGAAIHVGDVTGQIEQIRKVEISGSGIYIRAGSIGAIEDVRIVADPGIAIWNDAHIGKISNYWFGEDSNGFGGQFAILMWDNSSIGSLLNSEFSGRNLEYGIRTFDNPTVGEIRGLTVYCEGQRGGMSAFQLSKVTLGLSDIRVIGDGDRFCGAGIYSNTYGHLSFIRNLRFTNIGAGGLNLSNFSVDTMSDVTITSSTRDSSSDYLLGLFSVQIGTLNNLVIDSDQLAETQLLIADVDIGAMSNFEFTLRGESATSIRFFGRYHIDTMTNGQITFTHPTLPDFEKIGFNYHVHVPPPNFGIELMRNVSINGATECFQDPAGPISVRTMENVQCN